MKSYFFGDKFQGNAYTEFGSAVGEALENDDFSNFAPEEEKVLRTVTRLDEFEREIKLDFTNFYIIGYIDTNDNKKNIVTTIIDYKTGALKKVADYEDENYDQVCIYAAAIEQETGTLPKRGWVELIERDGNPYKGDDLSVGREVVRIHQDITPARVKKMKTDVRKVAGEVSDFYKVFKKLDAILVDP